MDPHNPSPTSSLEIAHVLFMDIVAYSQLPMDHQQRALHELQELVRNTREFVRAESEDRLLRLPTGDGMALVFSVDPEAPARCALELSRILPDHPEIRLRMGIHTGPVYRVADINTNHNVAGGGINIAQRVMDCGDAGHILVSKSVADVLGQISSWKGMLHDLGEAEAKHGVLVHLYNLYSNEAGNPELPHTLHTAHKTSATVRSKARRKKLALGVVAAAATAALVIGGMLYSQRPASIEIHSLAILGLENRSGDASQDYFSDGLTNALAAGLARLNGLRVIPPAATLIYRGMKKPPAEIGRELNADVLLDGTVSRAGDRVAIWTRLVNARAGRDLWSHTYDSAAADLPTSQNEMERDIAEQVHASAPDRARLIDTSKLDPRAYDLYLRGSYHLGRITAQDTDQAIGLYEQAVAIAPDFAPLQANLASAYAAKSFFFAPDDPECEGRAFAAIEKAFALDPNSAEAHLARGELLWRPSHRFPHRAALAEFRLAAAARPNMGEAWSQIASVLIHVGHLDEALVALRKAEALNPGQTTSTGRASEVYLFQGKPQLSLDEESRTPARMKPIMEFDHTWALIDLGRFEEAARSIRTGFKDSKAGAAQLKYAVSALLAARQGNRRTAESEIRAALAEPQGLGQFHHVTFMIACAYSVLGDVDRAQEWMEKTAAGGFPCFTLFEVEPSLERWRATPKGHEFLVKLRREWETTP